MLADLAVTEPEAFAALVKAASEALPAGFLTSDVRAAPPLGPQPRVARLARLAGQRSARIDEGAFVVEGPTLLERPWPPAPG